MQLDKCHGENTQEERNLFSGEPLRQASDRTQPLTQRETFLPIYF